MIKRIIIIIGAAAVIAGYSASLASAGTPVNWHARTCGTFRTWEHNRTQANLITLGSDSLHVAWRSPGIHYGLGSDVWGLVADIRSGAPGKYVTADVRYISKDC